MGSPRAGGWIAGTAFLTLIIFALTWFFLASPRFEAAAATALEADNARSSNDILRIQLVQLRKDFESLDEYTAELAGLRAQLPATADLDGYTQRLQELADANSVTLVDVTPGIAQTVSLAVPVATVATVAPATEETEDGAVETATAPAPPTALDGFVAIPFAVRVVGAYPNVSAFLEAVQLGGTRLFLVSQLDGTAQTAADATGGKPAVADGDLELNVTGFIYVLTNPADVADVVDSADQEPAVPALPSSDRNPFAPLG